MITLEQKVENLQINRAICPVSRLLATKHSNPPVFSRWLFSVLLTLSVIYSLISYLSESEKIKNKIIKSIFKVPVWSDLRSFGEQPIAKFSYIALIMIPALAYIASINIPWLNLPILPLPLNLKLTYFASWFLAVSLIIFAIACPKHVKQKSLSKNIQPINIMLNNVENPNIKLDTDEDLIIPSIDKELPLIRALCFMFFVLSMILAIVILFRSAILVLNA